MAAAPAAPAALDEATAGRRLSIALAVTAFTAVLTQVANEILIPPLVVSAVLFAALAALAVRRPGRRLRVIAAIAAALYLVMNAPYSIEDLAHPESFAGFAAALAGVLASVAVLALALAPRAFEPAGRARTLATGLGVLLVIGLVASAVAASGVSDDAAQPGDAVLHAEGNEFDPSVAVTSGAGLVVENGDRFRHTIVIEDTGLKSELPAHATRRIPIDLEPGEYRYFCDVPGHSMSGALEVSAPGEA